MPEWKQRNMVVLGMTYPAYSKTYGENACTGVIFEDTYEIGRIHPVPHRYLNEQRFKAFQRITAKIARHDKDPRPQSYRVDPKSIELGEVIGTDHKDGWERRRQLLERCPQRFKSVEAIKAEYEKKRMSLGIVLPGEVTGTRIAPKPPSERAEWEQNEKEVIAQMDWERGQLKPIDYVDARFMVSFRCDDPTCTGHEMAMLQWGIHELYRKLGADPERTKKVLDVMNKRLRDPERDVFMFIGNYLALQYNFGLMDASNPPRVGQPLLI